MRTDSNIKRRKSRQIMVGNVPVGGDAPIAVQSMTNTETTDIAATVAQIRRLEAVGADIVRVSVPSMDAAEAFGRIRQQVKVPLVADIHFDYKIALKVAELPIDAAVVFDSDMKWERKVGFKRQYFAFSIRRGLAGGLGKTGAVADDCSWTKKIPTDLDGSYFVGVSNPMLTEKEARTDAMRDAKDQVIRYLGEWLAEASTTAKKTVGTSNDLQTLMDDTKVKESISGGIARSVKDRNWCGPEDQASPSGMRQVMKVLAYFPNSERDAASKLALQTIIQRQKEAGRDTTNLEAMLKGIEGAQ